MMGQSLVAAAREARTQSSSRTSILAISISISGINKRKLLICYDFLHLPPTVYLSIDMNYLFSILHTRDAASGTTDKTFKQHINMIQIETN